MFRHHPLISEVVVALMGQQPASSLDQKVRQQIPEVGVRIGKTAGSSRIAIEVISGCWRDRLEPCRDRVQPGGAGNRRSGTPVSNGLIGRSARRSGRRSGTLAVVVR
jgi:hypothetical protein